jgi:predicted nucleotide-binding protein (sugar kinase/HSP70/actin superfamily)
MSDKTGQPGNNASQSPQSASNVNGDVDAGQYRRPTEKTLSEWERKRVTILFGGLTSSHERLIEGAWEGLGYTVKSLPVPDNDALAMGREYCSKGMCNPAYYTVGNLLKYLFALKKAGVPQIEERFAFVTAGSCGPCRFGAYETEYRRALAQAGFENFRILVIRQTDGLNQSDKKSGMDLDRRFMLALIRSVMMGDLLNELGYALRPYEIDPGAVDAKLEEGRQWLYWALRDKENVIPVLSRIKRSLDEIKLDYRRIKPKVKITGEFWAQTTEGDGNYHLARWLESEGAEVVSEPVGTWIEYLLWKRLQWLQDRRGIFSSEGWSSGALKEIRLKIGQVVFDSVFNTYRAALGFRTEPLAPMSLLARYAEDYYNTRIDGGEAHMEIAKTVHAIRQANAHLVVSVKPFGCMPSTQSDGVQVKVAADHPDSLFVSVETSGDSEVHVKSRVQMVLFEAKRKAEEEFSETCKYLEVDEASFMAQPLEEMKMPAAMTPLPSRQAATAANYLWWLKRPPALRSLPVPTEALTEIILKYRKSHP